MLPFYSEDDLTFKKQGTLYFFQKNGDEKLEIEIELARTDFEQSRGLMWRKTMEDKQGMLFLFPKEEIQSFWMFNTFIPLDIIFIDAKKKIVNIAFGKPHSIRPVDSEGPTQYVLEVNAGFCDKNAIKKGDTIEWSIEY